jgi:hypothetical protein
MLQGSLYEAELEIHNRTSAVRQGVERCRPSLMKEGPSMPDGWWHAVASTIDSFSLNARRVHLIRYGSWIAVGITIGVALSSLMS